MMRVLRLAMVALVLGGPVLTGRPGTAVAQTVHIATGCNNCHRLHGSPGPQLLQDPVLEDLCLSCHNDASPYPGAPPGPFAVHDGPKHSSPTSCAECHGHPGDAGSNLSLIRTAIPADTGGAALVRLPVAFTSRGTDAGQASLHSFADGDEDADGDYDGVCEVCHTNTTNHRNGFDLPGNPDVSNHGHERGRTCPDCHTHESGFAGGGPCSSCHDTGGQGTLGPNNRRAIIPEFSRASHHIVWADSVPSSDCQACHDQSEHQQGTVRLWNVDVPGDTSATFKLLADPFTTPTEAAKVELFCLACHDPAGAGPTQPFSDLNTPPSVDSTAWIASSHQAVGSYTCLDCHGSGHGSEKQNLLAPANVAPTPPANAEEEEGFCFNCHDSDGPSTRDIQSQFDLIANPINWVDQPAGLNDNPNLNDRHDVQYAARSRSGDVIECVHCHDPHSATAARPYKLDPDPGDGHVPGTDYYYYAATSDTLSEFCLDCHDGSFAAGIVDSLPLVVNIQTTWAGDAMGGRTSSGLDLEPGTGWAAGMVLPCWSCHTAHPRFDADLGTTNLFSLVDTVMNEAGTAPLDGYFQRVQGTWQKTFAYGINTNLNGADPVTDGGTFCNTCHDRTSMVSQDNCWQCHRHGDGGRW